MKSFFHGEPSGPEILRMLLTGIILQNQLDRERVVRVDPERLPLRIGRQRSGSVWLNEASTSETLSGQPCSPANPQ